MSHVRRGNNTIEGDAEHLPLPSQSDLSVTALPFQDGPEFSALRQFAGQLPILSDTDVMFFWLIANATNTENQDKL
ncbi:hypothetical protein LPJ73_007268, partial [Coemansia sp. RSA 2703]